MGNQIFTFSILRSSDSAADAKNTVFVSGMKEPVDDSYTGVARSAVEWIKSQPTDSPARAGDLKTAVDADSLDREGPRIQGLLALTNNQFVRAFRVYASSWGAAAHQELVESGEVLVAAQLLSVLHSLDDSHDVALHVKQIRIEIDFHELVGTPAWVPKKSLVRTPGICDHFVVRDELVGYEMGEIEDIKNYLRGERKGHSLRYLRVSEEEFTSETENETTRTSETATQQRNSMKSAAQTTANSAVGLDARVKTDGQYGPTKVSTDVGFQYSSSSSEAAQTASEFSTDVVQRSVEVVRERQLQRSVRRSRTELEENRDHAVDNVKGTDHLVGIYRWVDSVWKATTYRVGQRLVLEFLIPEPGRAVLQARSVPPPSKLPPAPTPPPDNLFDILTESSAAKYASMYGVEGIMAAPLNSQVIGIPFGTTEYKDSDTNRVTALVVKDIKIPADYIGETVFVAVTAMDRADTDVAANIVVDVAGAKPPLLTDEPGSPSNPVQFSTGVGRPNPDLRTFVVRSKSAFGPGATVPVTIYAEDTRGLAGIVEVHCRVSPKAFNQWKLDTVQKITGAYFSRLSEWEARKQAAAFDVAPTPPRVDLDALCRHACIASMLGKWPSASGRHDANGWPNPGVLTGQVALLIEFMEQAFEWSNLQYIGYPYYWAESTRWKQLLEVDDADPHVREFLRSGAVRIVLPVTLDMTDSVLFFLGTGIPWFGGPAPVPGELGYRAIADEINQARSSKPSDEVIKEQRYTLPTSLTILQETGVLPVPPA